MWVAASMAGRSGRKEGKAHKNRNKPENAACQ